MQRHGGSILKLAKAAFERFLRHAGPATVVGRRSRALPLVLAYHNIVPDGERPAGERTLHLLRRSFASQLDLLAEVAEVVGLTEVSEQPRAGRPRVAITWDDAYRGAVSCGVEEVVRRNLPATIFAAPGRLGDQSFWWDSLAESFGGEIPASIRERALDECAGRDELVSSRLGVKRDVSLPAHARSATEFELRAAAGRPGITVASHSWSHPNLSRLESPELEDELKRSYDWMARHVPRPVSAVAYPYGVESPRVRAAAAQAGYQTGWRIRGGKVPPSADLLALPRFNVPSGLSLDGFALRLSGLFLR